MLRFHKNEEVAFVTLGNILDKINLLFLHNIFLPLTFSNEDIEKGPVSSVKTFLLYIMQICPKYLLRPPKKIVVFRHPDRPYFFAPTLKFFQTFAEMPFKSDNKSGKVWRTLPDFDF